MVPFRLQDSLIQNNCKKHFRQIIVQLLQIAIFFKILEPCITFAPETISRFTSHKGLVSKENVLKNLGRTLLH